MRLVDLHAHCLPPAYRAAARRLGQSSFDGGMPIPAWSPAAALDFMDRNQIALQVLSLASPPVYTLDRPHLVSLTRRANHEIAELTARHPDRFAATAVLPLPDIDATLEAIDHCYTELRVCGVTLFTHYEGDYLGHRRFDPVFAALDARRALVLLHPTAPAGVEHTALGRPAPLVEFPFDTTRAVVDLLYTRTLSRYPSLRVVVPHAGAAVPALAWRIARFADDLPVPGRPVDLTAAAVFDEIKRLHYDIALSANAPALAALLAVADPARILFGSDFPFAPETVGQVTITGLLEAPCLTPDQIEDIGHRNATRLLRPMPVTHHLDKENHADA